MVIFIGVGLINNYSENGIQIPNTGMPIISESYVLRDSDSGNSIREESSLEIELSVSKNSDVLEAELAADFCVDTEPGVMLINYEIPEVLPLCIDEAFLDSNINITVWSYGGYTPDELSMNALAIYQPKTGKGGCVEIDWIPGNNFVCTNPAWICYGCEVEEWIADFVLVDPIQIDSNHLPDVITIGADWDTICDGVPSDDLDKWVHLGFVSSWEGCEREDQKFKLILAHKSCFSENPHLQM
ncbi:MAG: hypothetical protein ACW990_00955 [Promethearchaeota archaeon]